jgi:hypothetical protein
MNDEYTKDLAVDKFNLDEHWENQTLLYAKWAERHVESCAERDRLNERLEIRRGELNLKVRVEGLPDGIKITESVVESYINTHEDIMKLHNEMLEINEAIAYLSVAKSAMDHRRKSLEGLTDLYCHDYYTSDPKIKHEAKKAEEMARTERREETIDDLSKLESTKKIKRKRIECYIQNGPEDPLKRIG